MEQDRIFSTPSYAEIDPGCSRRSCSWRRYPGMRQYLEHGVAGKVLQFWQWADRCTVTECWYWPHRRSQTRRSVRRGHKATAVPRLLDRAAYLLDASSSVVSMYACCRGGSACLACPEDFSDGPVSCVLMWFQTATDHLCWYMDAARFASACRRNASTDACRWRHVRLLRKQPKPGTLRRLCAQRLVQFPL